MSVPTPQGRGFLGLLDSNEAGEQVGPGDYSQFTTAKVTQEV